MQDEQQGVVRRGYKAKTIKTVLAKKLKQWFESIEDVGVRRLVEKGTIVTGGSIASMLLGEPVNDYDIYFKDHATTKAVAEYYVTRFKQSNGQQQFSLKVIDEGGRVQVKAQSSGIAGEESNDQQYRYFESRPEGEASEYVSAVMDNPLDIEDVHEDTEIQVLQQADEKKYRPVFLTSNAITLSDKIQIVLRFYGEPDEIHENYDFVHCTSYYTSWNGALVLRPDALESLLSRELRYVGSKYPVCSIVRLRKFIARGWRINAGQILKMAMQVSALDLTDVKTLEDQLTGVDTAYFLELISRLKEKNPEKVNTTYLVEIVDRMF